MMQEPTSEGGTAYHRRDSCDSPLVDSDPGRRRSVSGHIPYFIVGLRLGVPEQAEFAVPGRIQDVTLRSDQLFGAVVTRNPAGLNILGLVDLRSAKHSRIARTVAPVRLAFSRFQELYASDGRTIRRLRCGVGGGRGARKRDDAIVSPGLWNGSMSSTNCGCSMPIADGSSRSLEISRTCRGELLVTRCS